MATDQQIASITTKAWLGSGWGPGDAFFALHERDDDFPDVCALLHVPEGIFDFRSIEDGHRMDGLEIPLDIQVEHQFHESAACCPLQGNMSRDVDSEESSVVFELVQGKLSAADHVTFANLYHTSVRGDAIPGGMKQLSRNRVKYAVNANAVGSCHKLVVEGGVSRVEDAVPAVSRIC